MVAPSGKQKSEQALKTIREVSEILDLPQHVLRFWESKFPQIQPLKRRGGRRFYRPEDIELLTTIKTLLHEKGYTIKGAVALLNKSGKLKLVADNARARAEAAAEAAEAPLAEGGKEQLASVKHELEEIRDMLKQAS